MHSCLIHVIYSCNDSCHHFVRTNEFVDHVEESIEAVPMERTGDEWTDEDQTVLDSEEDDDGDENDNEPIFLFSKTKMN